MPKKSKKTEKTAYGALPDEVSGAQNESAEESPERDERSKKKRKVLIFLLSLLVLTALLLPLLFIDYADVRKIFVDENNNTIIYCPADYYTDIWSSKEYNEKTVRKTLIYNFDGSSGERTFFDLQSAKEAFSALEDLPYGGQTLGQYFVCLISGIDGSDSRRYASLFSSGYNGNISKKFPPQKVCEVYVEYDSKQYAGGDIYVWRVSFDIVKNDGLAVNYLGSRDSGSAYFKIREYASGYKIEEISTIIKVNK